MSDEKPFSWLDGYEITHPKKRAFLAAYSELGTVTHAAEAAKVVRKSHYNWLKDDDAEIYKAAFDEAHQRACDCLEAEARRRAIQGVDKPIIRNGFVVSTFKEYSDTLLIFLMKGAMPDKYRERIDQKHSGSVSLESLVAGDAPIDPEKTK